MSKKIGVVGLGYVGLPLAIGISNNYNCIGYDINKRRVEELRTFNDINLDISCKDLEESISKNAWSPGRKYLSVKLCGCGLHLSPEIALMASTSSDPISYSILFDNATMSFSLTPGFNSSYIM